MKLKFFGDSWYWFWSYKDAFKSSTVKQHVVHGAAFPAMEAYFKYLGVDCIHENYPGSDFYQVVNRVIKSTPDPTLNYNVVFFSNLIRGDYPNHKFDVYNYDNFISKWQSDLVTLLLRLEQWGERHNQKILIIGGQSTLPREIFDTVEPRNHIFLVSECVSTDILRYYLNEPLKNRLGIFKLSTDFSYLVNSKWDRKLVNRIYDEQKEWSGAVITKNLFGPDNVHLNGTTQLYLVDLLLSKIEQMEK